jgi:hypothetical protein
MLTTLAFSGLMLFAGAQPLAPPANPVQAQGGGIGGANLVVANAAADPSPRIVELKPDEDGKVKISVMRAKPVNPPARAGAAPGGGRVIMVPAAESVELTDVKDLKVMTAAGKEVKTEDAIKALAKGGMVVVSSDGKEVPTAMLKLFKEDVLVLVSPELARGAVNGRIVGGFIPIGGPRNVPPANPAPPAPKNN